MWTLNDPQHGDQPEDCVKGIIDANPDLMASRASSEKRSCSFSIDTQTLAHSA